MNPNTEEPNIYIAELRSLLKDKFFMLLLGISVSIVVLSTIYSFVKPKNEGQVASGVQTAAEEQIVAAEPTKFLEQYDSIEGLEPVIEEKKGGNVFDQIKEKAQNLLGATSKLGKPEATVSPTLGSEVAAVKTEKAPVYKPGSQYVIQEGDTLWIIAEKTYNSGYNYVDLVAANNIMYPDYIEVGQKIQLPKVEPKMPTTGEITAQAASTKSESAIPTTYTTVEGDCLWNIAVSQYNDGYMWTRIAQLNNLPNPDFIMVGEALKLK